MKTHFPVVSKARSVPLPHRSHLNAVNFLYIVYMVLTTFQVAGDE